MAGGKNAPLEGQYTIHTTSNRIEASMLTLLESKDKIATECQMVPIPLKQPDTLFPQSQPLTTKHFLPSHFKGTQETK